MTWGPNRIIRQMVRGPGLELLVILAVLQGAAAGVAHGCDLLLERGQIITLDASDPIVSSIAISGNEILAVDVAVAGCTVVIDLDGRTVIPGLIDNHVHWSARASRPGHHVGEMDKAFSAAEAVEILNRNIGWAQWSMRRDLSS